MQQREPVSLLDIAPAYEDVSIDGERTVRVKGLSANSVIALMRRFPALQGILAGKGITREALADIAPEAIPPLIAAACGLGGDANAEANAAGLSFEAQFDILAAMGRLTFTSGFGPFVAKLMTTFGGASEAAKAGKVPDTKLRSRPPNSEAPATPPSST